MFREQTLSQACGFCFESSLGISVIISDKCALIRWTEKLGSTWRLPGVCPVLPYLGGKPWGPSSDSWPVMASLPESCGQRLGPRGLDPSAIWLSVISAPPWSVYLPWDKHFPPHLAKISIRSSKIEPRQLHSARGCRLRRATGKTSHLGFCTKVGRCWALGEGGPSPRAPTLGAREGRFDPLSPEGATLLYCSPGLASRFQRPRKVGGRAFQILTITILQTTHGIKVASWGA